MRHIDFAGGLARPRSRTCGSPSRTSAPFLAWVRTSVALIAGGGAVDAVELHLPPVVRGAVVAILLLLGLLLPVLAWLDWAATERAMRLGRPLPGSVVMLPLAAGALVVTVLVALGTALA